MILKSFIKKSIEKFGYEIIKTNNFQNKFRKLEDSENFEYKKYHIEKLVQEFPSNPIPQHRLASLLCQINDPNYIYELEKYRQLRNEWVKNVGMEKLDKIDFIPLATVTGSFGNVSELELLLRAKEYGLKDKTKPILLLPKNAQFRNKALFEYFEPFIHVVRDEENISVLKNLESVLSLDLGFYIPFSDCFVFKDYAANLIELERLKQGREPAFLKINEKHAEMGQKALHKLGIPDDAWYVTLHVREPGYRGEKPGNFRNANPFDYVDACKTISQLGGWVFRMGDPSMTPFPDLPNVVDYAHHEIRSDWMDVYLGATCRFLIATCSGYMAVPRYFGVPILFTNTSYTPNYFGLMEHDIYLFKLIKSIKTNRHLKFEEFLIDPICLINTNDQFAEMGLNVVDNSADEINEAVKEMLAMTEKSKDIKYSLIPNNKQKYLKKLLEDTGRKLSMQKVKAVAHISEYFIDKHQNLL